MQVTTEQRTPCEVELKIEVSTDKVAQAINQVYKEFSQTTSIPGFRKGKTPRAILERYASEDSIKQGAIEIMVPDAYMEAIKEQDIHPYHEPDVEVVQFETDQPFIFKAIIPLPPKVELGDYKGIEVERKVQQITDEDVDAQLKYLQESKATSKAVEGRGLQSGDYAIANISSKVDDEEMSEPRRSMIEVGNNVPGFDDSIVGMEAGQQKTFSVEYPADYPDDKLAGKKTEFDVTVESIKEKVMPELDDEFAKTIGKIETIDELKADIRKHLEETANETADREVEQKIVEEIANRSEVCFPGVMVDQDVHLDLEDLQTRLSRQGITIQQYMQHTGKSEEDMLNEYREAARQRLRVGLSLGEVADVEKIDVTTEEVEDEVQKMAEESNVSVESVESYIETRGGKALLRNSMLNKKIMDFIKSVSVIK